MENKIKLEHWEGNEYIITINGKPSGETVTKSNGKIIKRWLEVGIKETIENGNV